MAKPGIVLRRPVRTNATFSEHAELPTDLGSGDRGTARLPGQPSQVDVESRQRTVRQPERQARREGAARAKERDRRNRALAKAEAALKEAKRIHRETMEDLAKARDQLDRKVEAEGVAE